MQEQPTGLCECGCGGQTKTYDRTCPRRGWVKGAPRRFLNGHQFRRRGPEIVEEDRGHTTPCWIWQGHTDRAGYGQIARGGESYAHRWYYVQERGRIPEGLVLDHLCVQPPCVNPEHLEAVTQQENVRRSRNTRLTPEQVREIRASPLGSRKLCKVYGVGRSTIRAVKNEQSWKDIV